MRTPRTFAALAILTLGLFTAAFSYPNAADVTGEWVLRVHNPGADIASIAKFVQRGDVVQGSYVANTGREATVSGRAVRDSVTFAIAPMLMGRVATYRAVLVTPDSMYGTMDLEGILTAPFSAARRR